jgi:Interleukin-like EMT inducer
MTPGRATAAATARAAAGVTFSLTGTPHRGALVRRWFSADYVRRYPRAEYALTLSATERPVRRRVEVRFDGRLLATHEGPAQAVVSLPPPYRTGDRNELTFTHLYEIDPDVTREPGYRIGRTAVHSPVDIQALSAGRPYGDQVSILVNGQELVAEGPVKPRGYVVAALDARTGQPVGVRTFDTFARAAESRRMARFIGGLADGTIVVAAVRDEAGGQLEEEGVRALGSIGAREDLRGRFRMSHVVIGVKGAAPGDAVEAAGPQLLRASVGNPPLELVLESFALR